MKRHLARAKQFILDLTAIAEAFKTLLMMLAGLGIIAWQAYTTLRQSTQDDAVVHAKVSNDSLEIFTAEEFQFIYSKLDEQKKEIDSLKKEIRKQ